MKIGQVELGPETMPYLIAEIGGNHDGDLARAKNLIWQAARGGANAAKFQCFKADMLAHPDSAIYFRQDGPNPAASQHAFFQRIDQFGEPEYRELAATCAEAGIHFLCTPFDLACVGWLTPLVPAWKIASADCTNRPLLDAVAKTGKPLLLSTGGATAREITTLAMRYPDAALLHCVLAYPTPRAAANLLTIPWLLQEFNCTVGYSDHTIATDEMETCFLAYCLGARVIEKHFTGVGEQSRPGNDHYHSMDAAQLHYLKAAITDARTYFGHAGREVQDIEQPARTHARRGLYAARAIPEGKSLEAEDIAILRPPTKYGPECYEEFLGSPARQDYVQGEPL